MVCLVRRRLLSVFLGDAGSPADWDISPCVISVDVMPGGRFGLTVNERFRELLKEFLVTARVKPIALRVVYHIPLGEPRTVFDGDALLAAVEFRRTGN